MGMPAPEPVPVHRVSKATYQDDHVMQPGLTQGITDTAMEHSADASFISSSQTSRDGSTPKRSKPRHLSKDLSAHVTTTSKASRRTQAQRAALRPISPNRRHTTVGVLVTGRKEEAGRHSLPLRKRRGSSGERDEEQFTTSFVESTPSGPGQYAGTWRQEDGSITEL